MGLTFVEVAAFIDALETTFPKIFLSTVAVALPGTFDATFDGWLASFITEGTFDFDLVLVCFVDEIAMFTLAVGLVSKAVDRVVDRPVGWMVVRLEMGWSAVRGIAEADFVGLASSEAKQRWKRWELNRDI